MTKVQEPFLSSLRNVIKEIKICFPNPGKKETRGQEARRPLPLHQRHSYIHYHFHSSEEKRPGFQHFQNRRSMQEKRVETRCVSCYNMTVLRFAPPFPQLLPLNYPTPQPLGLQQKCSLYKPISPPFMPFPYVQQWVCAISTGLNLLLFAAP